MQADGFLKAGNQSGRDLVRTYSVSFAARELTRQAFKQASRCSVELNFITYKSDFTCPDRPHRSLLMISQN